MTSQAGAAHRTGRFPAAAGATPSYPVRRRGRPDWLKSRLQRCAMRYGRAAVTIVATALTTLLLLGASGGCNKPGEPSRVSAYAQFAGNATVLDHIGELGDCLHAFSGSDRARLTQREKRCIGTGSGLLALLGSGLTLVLERLPGPYRTVLAALATVLDVAAAGLSLLALDPPDPRYPEPVQAELRTVTLVPGPLDAAEFSAVRAATRVAERQAAYAQATLIALNRATTAERAGAYGYARSRARQARAFAGQLGETLHEAKTKLQRLHDVLEQDKKLNDSLPGAVTADQITRSQQALRSSGQLPPTMYPYLAQLGVDSVDRAHLMDAVLAQDSTSIAALGTTPTPTPSPPTPTPPVIAHITSNTGGANLRLDASTDSDSAQYLPDNTAVIAICRTAGQQVDPPNANYSSDRWLKIKVIADSTIGYVHSSLIDRQEDIPNC